MKVEIELKLQSYCTHFFVVPPHNFRFHPWVGTGSAVWGRHTMIRPEAIIIPKLEPIM